MDDEVLHHQNLITMHTYQTSDFIADLQFQTESLLSKVIAEWQILPKEKMLTAPAPNGWSAVQCLEHLNTYGRYYLPAIEKGMETAKAKGYLTKSTYKPGWLGNYFTQLMKPKAEGKKMKKMKAAGKHVPAAILNSHVVVAEFIDQLEQLYKLLEEAKNINLEKTKVAISIATFIKLQLGDVFSFLIAHIDRHMVQAGKAIKNSTSVLQNEPA